MAYDGYGMPAIDFRPLGQLGEVYNKAKNEQTLSQLGEGLASGKLDYRTAAGMAAQAGQIPFALNLIKLNEERAAQEDFKRTFGDLVNPAPTAAAPAPSPVAAPAPVQAAPAPIQAAAGSPNERVATAFNDTNAAIESGAFDPQGANMPQRATLTQGAQPPPTPPAPTPQAQPAVQPRTNPLQGQTDIRRLMAVMSHPGASPGQRDAAKLALGEALKTPDNLKEYDFYTRQESAAGRQPLSFLDYTLKKDQAKATMINTAEGMDAAQAKARIDIDKHAVQDLSKKAVAGRSALPLLEQVFRLADKTPGGWAGQVSPVIARALSGAGFNVPEGISNAELLSSVSRQFIPSVRDPGSTSNYEQQLYTTAVPGLAQSQEGRVKIARMFRAQIERNNEILAVYRQYVGSPQLDEKLRELDNKPIFSAEDRKTLEGEVQKQTGVKRETKTLNGKTYYKENGQWFEQ